MGSATKIDWSQFDAATDAQIKEAARKDRDAAPVLTPAWLKKARVVRPLSKDLISIRLDKDVLEHFRSEERWQTRINSILRMVMEDDRRGTPSSGVRKPMAGKALRGNHR